LIVFTGLIEAVGKIAALAKRGEGARLDVDVGGLDLGDVKIGDSIAVSGACLTVVHLVGKCFSADVSSETLRRTTLGELKTGDPVNLEKALLPTTRLGGHLVSGHVDGVGVVRDRKPEGASLRFSIEAPKELARYIAEKGSICVDGVSLTVNGVDGASFDITIIPHTGTHTTIGAFEPGRRVNLEVDVLARYLERLRLGDAAADAAPPTVTRELLARQGYLK
jgi:riboflavin synthase